MSKSRTRRFIAILVPLAALSIAAIAVPSSATEPSGAAGNAIKLTPATTAALSRQLRTNTVSKSAYKAKNLCAAIKGMPKLACDAQVLATATGKDVASDQPVGFGPADIQQAYGASSVRPNSVVAIYAPGDGANVVADVAEYRRVQGLAACADCVQQVPYDGPQFAPPAEFTAEDRAAIEEGAGVETTLDAEMVTAACPSCRIKIIQLPIEAAFQPGYDDADNYYYMTPEQFLQYFGYVVATAQHLQAAALSVSWGYDFTLASDQAKRAIATMKTPGMAIVASSGDSGNENILNQTYYGENEVLDLPTSAPNAIVAGGTSLYANASGGFSEVAWSGAGSSCAAEMPPAAGQPVSVSALCGGHRATSDVSAVADPYTGVAIYDSYSPYYQADPFWTVAGGTSVAAPIVAGLIASSSFQDPTSLGPNRVYSAPRAAIHDVTLGANAYPHTCGGSALCFSGVGWDGPTGVGTPANSYALFNGPMLLRNEATGQCLDLGSGSHGTIGQIAPCLDTKTRVAPLFRGSISGRRDPSNAVPVIVAGANTCLDVAYESSAKAASVVPGSCTGHASQQWMLSQVVADSKRFVIRNVNSGLCIDVNNHVNAVRSKVTQGPCIAGPAGQAWQTWDLVRSDGS